MSEPALRIAIVGAESTGKSTLAAALAQRLGELSGRRCTAVGEWLRTWCEQQGRTPLPQEQRAVAEHQQAQIDAACADHDIVVCDTTALMTSVYSDLLFADRSLEAYAMAQQGRCDITLLTALDIEWQADGLQRDGPQVRPPVDARVRSLLMAYRLPWALVSGQGLDRLESALDAVTPLLRERGLLGPGLFTRLSQREARDLAQSTTWAWQCDDCDVPGCEHALLRAAGKPQALPSERRQP